MTIVVSTWTTHRDATSWTSSCSIERHAETYSVSFTRIGETLSEEDAGRDNRFLWEMSKDALLYNAIVDLRLSREHYHPDLQLFSATAAYNRPISWPGRWTATDHG